MPTRITPVHAVRDQGARGGLDLLPELVVGDAVGLMRHNGASLSPKRSAVLRRLSPIVSPSSGTLLAPCASERPRKLTI